MSEMKTLIFNGSPRKKGDTVSLLKILTSQLEGEYKIVDTYCDDIKPCIDCRYCWNHQGCAIKDEMQEVYEYIQECDNIVIASPLYYSELTGPLLSVASRLQTYYCSRVFRKEVPISKLKRGGVILVGGGDGDYTKAEDTAIMLLRHLKANKRLPAILSHNTNNIPAGQDETAVFNTMELARFLNRKEEN